MIRLFTIFTSLILLASCGPSIEPLSPSQIEVEKESVIEVLQTYNRAVEEENFAGILPTLSQNVFFYGTDSSEVIKDLNEFKKKITEQFNSVDKMQYGEMTDISIQMDPYGNFASIIYGLPVELEMNGINSKMFLRGARTLMKEDGRWVIVSGIIGVAGGTSSVPADTVPQ